MRTFSTSFLALKNRLEGAGAWAHLVEISYSANSIAYLTSHPETLSYAGRIYIPVPLRLEEEQLTADGTLPRLRAHVGNYGGVIYSFLKNFDLTRQPVTVRTIHTLSSSGDEAMIALSIFAVTATNEVAQFDLGLAITMDAEGPRRTYNRRDYPGMPLNFRQFVVVA